MPLLWTSALGFKARVDLLACMLHCLYASLPVYNGIFRFASGVTPAYYLATSIVTKLCWSTYCVHKHWWGSNLGCSMSLPLSVTQDWCSTKWAKLAQLRGIHSNWTSYKRDQCICKGKQEGISVWTCWGEVSLYGEDQVAQVWTYLETGQGWGVPVWWGLGGAGGALMVEARFQKIEHVQGPWPGLGIPVWCGRQLELGAPCMVRRGVGVGPFIGATFLPDTTENITVLSFLCQQKRTTLWEKLRISFHISITKVTFCGICS